MHRQFFGGILHFVHNGRAVESATVALLPRNDNAPYRTLCPIRRKAFICFYRKPCRADIFKPRRRDRNFFIRRFVGRFVRCESRGNDVSVERVNNNDEYAQLAQSRKNHPRLLHDRRGGNDSLHILFAKISRRKRFDSRHFYKLLYFGNAQPYHS